MLNPSSRCSRMALSFSSAVNRRALFAPPAPLGGLFLFFSATTSSFMLTLHLSLECQPLSCLNQSYDLVVSTTTGSFTDTLAPAHFYRVEATLPLPQPLR